LDSLISRIKDKVNSVHTNLAFRNIVDIKLEVPIVSFTFDDFPISAYEVGGRILEDINARGTFYTSLKYLNSNTDLGVGYTQTDLIKLINKGHELGCHTYDHLDAAKYSPDEFEISANKNQNSLNENLGYNYKLENFAYPFGRFNAKLKGIISRAFNTARGTSWGINYRKVDLNNLNACKLYGKNDAEDRIKNIIIDNRKLNSWLIFYTHDVRLNSSNFGCTPDLFKLTLTLAKDSGALILPVKKAFDNICKNND